MTGIALRFPFRDAYPISFVMGAIPGDVVLKKFSRWGLRGHNGIDFGLPKGTNVLASEMSLVVASGENGDFGLSITIQHPRGTSLYAHLSGTKVSTGDHVKGGQFIGLSGQTGAAFGPHLHFGIMPTQPDRKNGDFGFINPSPYFKYPHRSGQKHQ